MFISGVCNKYQNWVEGTSYSPFLVKAGPGLSGLNSIPAIDFNGYTSLPYQLIAEAPLCLGKMEGW